MGTPRVMFDADELVISKAGEDATDAALPDTDKIFDSKWLFGLQVLGSGVWSYPRESSVYREFTLPDYGFRPALMFRTKTRPSFIDRGYEYEWAQGSLRSNISSFTGAAMFYDRGTTAGKASRFITDTTVRIYRIDPDAAVDLHWMAVAL